MSRLRNNRDHRLTQAYRDFQVTGGDRGPARSDRRPFVYGRIEQDPANTNFEIQRVLFCGSAQVLGRSRR